MSHVRDYRETKAETIPAGMLEHEARTAFRDLVRVYGFQNARQIMAEIINDEAER